MFLRRITVTGFKSFANKTVLNLEPGITGVVGPNGSGKSNVADAIRWALGEQSKGRLRLSDREEVVFAGTDSRAKASYAEVVLLFDNEDGAFPLDLTEVEISRRLYRSGEAEYRLGRRNVRLADIQMLLAQAGFGLGTYAVIGQGMIDTLLMSSPAERKLLFDEAAGIRGPELGREAALRKLSATQTNLTRLADIAAELAPRLSSLQGAVVTESELERLQARVAELRAAVISTGTVHWAAVKQSAADRLAATDAELSGLHKTSQDLARQLAEVQDQAAAADRRGAELQQSLSALEHERDQLGQRLSEQRSALASATKSGEEVAKLQGNRATASAELDAATQRSDELQSELASNAVSQRRAQQAVEKAAKDVAAAQAALVALRKSTGDGNRDQYLDHALQILKTMAINLSAPGASLEEARLLVHKAGRLLSHAARTGAAELLESVKTAQKQLETAMSKRETAVEHQTNITITARSLEIDLAHQHSAVTRAQDRVSQVEADIAAAQQQAAGLLGLQSEIKRLTATFAEVTAQLEQQREQVRALTATSTTTQTQIELAAAIERGRSATSAAEAERARAEASLAEAGANLAALSEQAAAWGMPTLAPDHIQTATAQTTTAQSARAPKPALADSPESLAAQLVRAETMLEARAAARASQAAEYEEVNTRHAELVTQITDLETAKIDLEKVVAELDVLIRARFKENFQALSAQFTAYFARLFEGGAASLELTEAEDGAYGVAIKASPRGKRLASIAALSGGERALAGVALLAAILRVNPSPFVVLDEIDAALDEANSGRLAGILSELREHSQLIVITHNRQTMRAASVLFGVTINEHHVSHILSMRLEEATSLAAR